VQCKYLEGHAAYWDTFVLHVVLEGISRGFSAVNIWSSWSGPTVQSLVDSAA
jgi:hypothetical protein